MILRFYDFHDKGTIKFIDMEYIDGESLSKLYLFKEEEVKRYAKQILEGLGYAHDQRIIHKDVKPQNIILTMKYERTVQKLQDAQNAQ